MRVFPTDVTIGAVLTLTLPFAWADVVCRFTGAAVTSVATTGRRESFEKCIMKVMNLLLYWRPALIVNEYRTEETWMRVVLFILT